MRKCYMHVYSNIGAPDSAPVGHPPRVSEFVLQLQTLVSRDSVNSAPQPTLSSPSIGTSPSGLPMTRQTTTVALQFMVWRGWN